LASQKIEVKPEKYVKISQLFQGAAKEKYTAFLKRYSDVFAWSHTDIKGIPPYLGHHGIDLLEGSIPIRQRQYRLNPKYSVMVKEEIDKLTEAGFIFPVLSQGYKKLNAATKKDHYPLPFTDIV
jgi:hypothetical protein